MAIGLLAVSLGCARAREPAANDATIRDCITAAAAAYHEPPAVLVILLNVEGGLLGQVSYNTNGTVDIGPMQVNQIWLPNVAGHWRTTVPAAYTALRDSFCANVEAGAWILRHGLDEAHGDFWQGVGYYHSHDPEYKRRYLHAVLMQVLRLRSLAVRSQGVPPAKGAASAAALTPARAARG
jgi:hypothetical protein